MTLVPEKLLRANPNDHPTELMSLRGARLAVIDETPEAGQLNVQRLKAILGQSQMTARAVRQDNTSWKATHSLVVMTNYRPIISETDHGTWRRLALVKFSKTFPPDESFRTRMRAGKGGRREAVLAWIVEGAMRWYAAEQVMPGAPERVALDTREWRKESDLMLSYIGDRIVFDPQACVTVSDLLDDVNEWLDTRGHHKWADKLLTSRFGEHDEVTQHRVVKTESRALQGLVRRHFGDTPRKAKVWLGVRWRTEADDEQDERVTPESDSVAGVAGGLDKSIVKEILRGIGTTRDTRDTSPPEHGEVTQPVAPEGSRRRENPPEAVEDGVRQPYPLAEPVEQGISRLREATDAVEDGARLAHPIVEPVDDLGGWRDRIEAALTKDALRTLWSEAASAPNSEAVKAALTARAKGMETPQTTITLENSLVAKAAASWDAPPSQGPLCACGKAISNQRVNYGKTDCVECERRAS